MGRTIRGNSTIDVGVLLLMKQRSAVVSDEEFGRQLLTDHLSLQGKSEFRCDVNSADPPDLLVAWEDGSLWGVEVTRTYQQVASCGRTGEISSAQITEPLFRFGEKLGEETKSVRRRDYTLGLGRDPGDILTGPSIKFGRAWKEKTEKAVRQHIAADEADILECPGVWLKPGGAGNRWTVTVNAGVAEMQSAISSMLARALDEKTKALPRWNEDVTERWLLLLNAYPLVNDVGQLKRALTEVTRWNPSLCGFDGIFWSGYPDRALVAIPVAEFRRRS